MTSVRKVAPQVVPEETLTLKAIRDEIPKHYFEQNTMKSMYYLCRDLVQVAITAAVWYYYGLPLVATVESATGPVVGNLFKFLMWNVYWYVQGLNGTGLWVLAHECGHRAFSPSKAVNDTVGMIVHSFLLVPYHSWRISHANHHKHTNHTELDTVFVPDKVAPHAIREAFNEAPIISMFYIVIMWTLGWPMYLAANVTGQKYNRRANHFEPSSPLYRPSEGGAIVESDIGLVAVAAFFSGMVYSGYFTWTQIGLWYFIPYLWVNFWLVSITYLQHTDIRLPHYNPENWNFVRGALATVDRDFGAIHNWWLHHIHDSHVVHHVFSTMPFYNAIEVTRKYIHKAVPKGTYLTDDRHFLVMLWESWRNCRYIKPTDGIAWYRK